MKIKILRYPERNLRLYRFPERLDQSIAAELHRNLSSVPGIARIEIYPDWVTIIKNDQFSWRKIEGRIKAEIKKHFNPKFKKSLFCPHCQNKFNPQDKFCNNCGKKKLKGGRIDPFGCFMRIILFAAIGLILFSFFGVYIGSHSLDGIDHLNLWYEKNHSVAEADRIVYVKAVFDEEYANICLAEKDYGLFFNNSSFSFMRTLGPEERIAKVVSRASKSFEYQFGIKFVLLKVEKWHSQNWDSLNLINELRNEVPLDDCDIVIGFTGKNADMNCRGEMPRGGHLGNYVLEGFYVPVQMNWISRIFNSHHLQSYTLTHELGHCFGAIHPEETGTGFQNFFSVMNAATGIFTTHFDQYNGGVIFQNKHLPSK